MNEIDEVQFYAVELHWLSNSLFLLWRTNSTDEYLHDQGRLLAWQDIDQLSEFARTHGHTPLQRDVSLRIDLDALVSFLDGKTSLAPDRLIEFWNFFLDIEATWHHLPFSNADSTHRDLYGKIFAMTSAGRTVGLNEVSLSHDEATQTRDVLSVGLSMVVPLIDPLRNSSTRQH